MLSILTPICKLPDSYNSHLLDSYDKLIVMIVIGMRKKIFPLFAQLYLPQQILFLVLLSTLAWSCSEECISIDRSYFLENRYSEGLKVSFFSLSQSLLRKIDRREGTVAAGQHKEILKVTDDSELYETLEESGESLRYEIRQEMDDLLLAEGLLSDTFYRQIATDPTIDASLNWSESERKDDCGYSIGTEALFNITADFTPAYIRRAFRLYNNSPEIVIVDAHEAGQTVFPRRTIIAQGEIATIYETTTTFTGPITYRLYRDSDGMLLLDDVVRDYDKSGHVPHLNWQHRSQVAASLLALPTETNYQHEYYATYPNSPTDRKRHPPFSQAVSIF